MKTIIAGGRDFDDYTVLESLVSPFHDVHEISEVVCGEARGADSLGKRWAKNHNVKVVSFFPDWKNNGKAAGYIRNKQMGDYADILIAFWDGKSRGTKNMIDYMKKLGKTYIVYSYDGYLIEWRLDTGGGIYTNEDLNDT